MFLAAITLMAQNSFVVVDRNGNSKLVQDLIFQQKNGAFSWRSSFDGYQQDQDIKDLLFIARAKNTLATGSVEEVTQMLEELSGTDQADAEAVAAALRKNSNVAEATSSDGNNVVVRYKDSEGYAIYPMYELKAPFSELAEPTEPAMTRSYVTRTNDNRFKKIAIFNFFEGIEEHKVQNNIVNSLMNDFKEHGYTDLTYFYPNHHEEDKRFTYENLKLALANSADYATIIIFSHGACHYDQNRGITRNVFCTGERAESERDGLYIKEKLWYYKYYSTAELYPRGNCILYLGVCDGWDDENMKNRNTPVLGFSGKTVMAEAKAVMLYHLMLYEGYSLHEAYDVLPDDPAPYKDTRLKISNISYALKMEGDEEKATKYIPGLSIDYGYTRSLEGSNWYYTVSWRFPDNYRSYVKSWARLKFVPLLGNNVNNNNSWTAYDPDDPSKNKLYQWTRVETEGMYLFQIEGIKEVPDGKSRISPLKLNQQPHFLFCSKNFKENAIEGSPNMADITAPVIIGTDGKSVEDISVAAGSTQTYSIDGYEGHTFRCATLDTDVADVSISGKTLTVKGVSEGSTYIGVMDEQNKRMTIAEVTVTAGGDTPGPGGDVTAYTACPDDHHPHLIDLGLPSGTKWACCNVGADKPEGYGGYYAWGETTTKDVYDWDTYLHGTWGNTVDIGSDIAGTSFDAATANWGAPWRMPTLEQCRELIENCICEFARKNGVKGKEITGPNGSTIFLPFAGLHDWKLYPGDDEPLKLYGVGYEGCYWSSTVVDSSYYPYYSWLIETTPDLYHVIYTQLYQGLSIRPVTNK